RGPEHNRLSDLCCLHTRTAHEILRFFALWRMSRRGRGRTMGDADVSSGDDQDAGPDAPVKGAFEEAESGHWRRGGSGGVAGRRFSGFEWLTGAWGPSVVRN